MARVTPQDVETMRHLLNKTTGLQLGNLPPGVELTVDNFVILLNNAIEGQFAKLQQKLMPEVKKREHAGMPPDFPRGYPK